MLKTILAAILPFLVLFSNGSDRLVSGLKTRDENNGTLEKMIVAGGSVSMTLDTAKMGLRSKGTNVLQFESEKDAFFQMLVFNDELRGPMPGSMNLIPSGDATLPSHLNASYRNLALEHLSWEEMNDGADLVIRDNKTGFIFFDVIGYGFDYAADRKNVSITDARLTLSGDYAKELGRPGDAGITVGTFALNADLKPIEVTEIKDGGNQGETIVAVGTRPGPDVVVGDVNGLAQFGNQSGTVVGLSLGTDSCNFGTVNLDWFQMPVNDHPVIPQNFYRMSGGAGNDQTFEQIGASQVKHAFTALTNNICSLGCNGTGGEHLGSGCSDPYVASLNSGPSLGSRAWINPYTGFYPRGDSATDPNNHAGHGDSNSIPGHRMRVEVADLNTTLNTGATYYAEGQYVTPHEYTWCQSNPGQCNMDNNVSYRRYNVNGTASPFSFSAVGSTNREKAAITAWTGATVQEVRPAPGQDGIFQVAYKVTNPSAGVWHYEYAVYNQDLDRGIQSFSIPVASGVTISNTGFHAPPQQPGTLNDGTVGNTGFSSAAWSASNAGGQLTWGSETMLSNANANAIRWGTLYNFRFDSNRPPTAANATVGFFKTGSPVTVAVQAPQAAAVTAPVSVSGRLTTAAGSGVRGALITLKDSGGNTLFTTITSPFGYFAFTNVPPGATYTLGGTSKLYTINSQSVTVNDNITDIQLTAQ